MNSENNLHVETNFIGNFHPDPLENSTIFPEPPGNISNKTEKKHNNIKPVNTIHNKQSKTIRQTFYKRPSTYNVCNNCGKSGHLFHQCKMPIISIGIIVFRIVQEDPPAVSETSNISGLCPSMLEDSPPLSFSGNASQHSMVSAKNLNIEYLIIRRKETLGYIDFMRGKYFIQNKDYIMNMLKQMTNDEKEQLTTKSFDELWQNIWGSSHYNSQYKLEENNSKEKFNTLVNGVHVANDFYTLNDLIQQSNTFTQWDEPEWGFPKGRRSNQETDLECAMREFSEETGYPTNKLIYLQNVIPFEEIFTGSNYKSYKHKYFLMFMNYSDTMDPGQFQTSEVSKIEWKSYDECVKYFRPYNLEKKCILKKVEQGLRKYKIGLS